MQLGEVVGDVVGGAEVAGGVDAGEVEESSEGGVQAVCPCGWRSPVFGTGKTDGTMDPLRRATDAGDLQQWEMSLP